MQKQNRYIPPQMQHLPLSQMEIFLELTAGMGIIFGILIVARSWSILPALIPTHFGLSGSPDAWGGKTSLLLLPMIALAMYLSITILSRFPQIFNYPCRITEQNYVIQYYLARSLLAWLKTEIIWLFAVINWLTIQTALGSSSGLGTIFMPLNLLVIFGTLGVYLHLAYQNR